MSHRGYNTHVDASDKDVGYLSSIIGIDARLEQFCEVLDDCRKSEGMQIIGMFGF